MAVAALSIPAVINQIVAFPCHGFQSFDYSGFLWSNIKGKKAVDANRMFGARQVVLTLQGRKLKTNYLLARTFNENEQAERNSSCTCIDNNDMLLPLEDGENSDYSTAEIVSSFSCLQVDQDWMGDGVSLLDKLKAVQLHILASEQWNISQLRLCHRNYLVSATNLIHYLALRCLDVQQLQEELSLMGLLNLESINSHILASITTCMQLMENLKSSSLELNDDNNGAIINQKILNQQDVEKFTVKKLRRNASLNKQLLLGPVQDGRTTNIMVTIGQEAIEREMLITDLIRAGASIVRINCAHGCPSLWSEIIKRVKECSQMLEKPCRILMDLAGPKLRTGNLKPGPPVLKLSPHKDAAGNVILPAQIWLSHKEAGPLPANVSLNEVLYIDNQKFLSKLQVGDTLKFCDARGKKRLLKISKKFHVFCGTGYVAECSETAYVESGTKLYIKGESSKSLLGQVVDVPVKDPFIRLRVGDLLIISRNGSSEQPELSVSRSGVHRITCPSGYLFDSVKPGEPIAFDDGKIWGVIQGINTSEIVVSITHAGPKGTKLRSEKSINIPESNVKFEGLTSKDLMDLEFVATHADMVGVSFVRNIHDVAMVRQELENRNLQHLGIVLKIETKSGVENLPFMLIEAMKCPNPLGVMIARGDLAVECGWEKLADFQEEILSLCNAAHVPVIWATQVLESLVKSGVPTRAEVTDAAKAKWASCVMLNKGRHIVKAVSTLDKILHSNSTRIKPFYTLPNLSDEK